MSISFTYPRGGRPIIPVKLIKMSKSISTTALVDSGGDISILPHFQAELLGIKHLRMPPTKELKGISGISKGVAVQLDIYVEDPNGAEKHTVKNVEFFIPREKRDFVIIGRQKFFEYFDVTIKHRLSEIILTHPEE